MTDSVSRLQLLTTQYVAALVALRPYLIAAPALIVMLVLALVLSYASLVPADIRSRYLDAARQAIQNDRMDLAKVYYGRLIEEGEKIDPQDELNWASILASNGEYVAAQRILEKLAPDDRAGFGPAHKQRAIQLVSTISRTTDPQNLERLQFHLKNIGDERSAEVNRMWSAFYFAVGQPKAALSKLEQAAERAPEMWFSIAAVAKQLSDDRLFKTALANAESYYLTALERNPFDASSRDLLCRTLLASDRVDEAQAIVDQGLKLQDIPAIHRSAANVLLYRFDKVATAEPIDIDTANRLLAAAFDHDPNYHEIYNRLISMYQTLSTDDQRFALRENLESLVVEGKVTPYAHFSLGSIEWLDGNQQDALWHLEKAYELDDKLLNVANNLAWVLAALDPPDLERAYELAKGVVARAPDQTRYRDTLATILLKQQRWDEALVEFERILPSSTNKSRIHENLATTYEALGRTSLAELHRQQATAAQQN